MDGTYTRLGKQSYDVRLVSTVEQAVQMGADMGVINVFCGTQNEAQMLEKLGLLAAACDAAGLPLMAEMLPSSILDGHYGGSSGEQNESGWRRYEDDLKLAARVGAELGADVIKAPYTGTVDGFKDMVESTGVPIVVAGGPKAGSESELLDLVRDCMQAGAAGVCIGRNVWQSKDVVGLLREIRSIVHEQN
jgi:fructose-bisphosphate aldolase / 2-amino-3,7-dideoxy-D-threo-hept-6-ulosonate synthase